MEDIKPQLKEIREKIAQMEKIKKTMEEGASKEATTGASKEASVVPEVMEMERSRPVFKGSDRCGGECAGCRLNMRNCCCGFDCNGRCGGRKRRRSKRRRRRRSKRIKRRRTRRITA